MRIQINKELWIGDGCRPFIIAEVGSNWRNLDDCLNSIQSAKACGADAVKFQLFDYLSLYGHASGWLGVSLCYPDYHGTNPYLNPKWLPTLKAHSELVGIEFMCSAFSPELIRVVDPYVNVHKVASAEMNHKRMLEELKRIGKPVILSTGGHNKPDITASLDLLKGVPLALMYCVAAYPAKEVHLERIQTMKDDFQVPVGFSDHTTDICVIPRRACELGASIIEKHVNFVGAEGPDAPHSLNQSEFKKMVDSVRGQMDLVLGYTGEEYDMIKRHNRRLIAIRDIAAGEKFIEGENFGIYRSLKDDAKALHPFCVDLVNGMKAKTGIAAGEGIAPNDV